MSCAALLKEFMFTHARRVGAGSKVEGDGRPLYAYRCSERFYGKLRACIADSVPEAVRGAPPSGFEACFCLYAAETFHREHVGGPWAWRTVFDPLGVPIPPNPTIGQWVEKGLAHWKRPLRTGASGYRLMLVTIACEGGLPLRLLQKEGAHLRRFFRSMLEDYHMRAISCEGLEALAREHVRRLPSSLRNEEVVQLAAALVGKTVELQEVIGDVSDPIAALDAARPEWRAELPLRLDDDVASALFQNLVEQSRQMALAAAARPAWLGWLEELAPDRFAVRKQLRFPERLSEAELAELANKAPPLPPRVRLSLESAHRSEPLAVLTHFARGGEAPIYRREWARSGGGSLSGASVLEPHWVSVNAGEPTSPLRLEGGAEWGECPWVFVRARDEQRWAWLTEGSGATQRAEALVAVPADCLPHSPTNGMCERRGTLAQPERDVYKVTGSAEFVTPEGDRYRVQCGAENDSRGALRLAGDTLPSVLNREPVYRGTPRFQQQLGGAPPAHRDFSVQWRPVGPGEHWRTADRDCSGQGWLRLVDAASGVEQVRRRVNVVPRESRLEREIGTDTQPGQYRLKEMGGASVSVVAPRGASISAHPGDDVAEVLCPPLPAGSLVPLKIELAWSGGAPIVLELPYPQTGVMFQLDGRALEPGELVALDRLYGLWAILQHPSGGERFSLEAELQGLDTSDPTLRNLGFVETLPPLRHGTLDCNIGSWIDLVRSLLAATDDLGATVALSIRSRTQEELARVRVARFDIEICPVRATDSVLIPIEALKRLGPDWPKRLTLEMLPLWAPNANATPLTERNEALGSWTVPTDLEPGPWWIVARDGGWARFRPLLWTVAADRIYEHDITHSNSLAGAVRDPDPETRVIQIDNVLRALALAPDHPDWELLFGYVSLSEEFPPNALDVLNRLTLHQGTLALALLLSDDAQFERLVSFADQMPFAWGLVPVDTWRCAAKRYFDHLREALEQVEGVDDILWSIFEGFRNRAVAARPFFGPLCDWLQEQLFPERPLANSGLALIKRLGRDFLRERVDEEQRHFQGRHDADEIWPPGSQVMKLTDGGLVEDDFRFEKLPGFQRPVRCAPFLAASLANQGSEIPGSPARLVHELRVLRGFDTEWFDNAYAQALALGLAERSMGELA